MHIKKDKMAEKDLPQIFYLKKVPKYSQQIILTVYKI